MNKLLLSVSLAVSALCVQGAMGQTWTRLKNRMNFGANNPMLLFDGTVLMQGANTNQWFRLTPDSSGSYVNGTWTTLPTTGNFSPLYYSSQIMPDGRVFLEGGEYNGGGAVWSNLGAIYDPAANTFATLAPPPGWSNIGDMGSITLPNGKVLVQDPFTTQGALFDWTTNKFTSPYGSGKRDANDEEGLTLLPNGKVFTIDVVVANGAELFDPATGKWSAAANTPYNVVDTADLEIGAQVVRPDGNVICFGGNGSNAVYHPASNTWTSAPAFPTLGGVQLTCADAPACLLPNGNVLVDTSPGYGADGCAFFEWNGTAFTSVPLPPDGGGGTDFVGNMLTLPTGQILFTDFSNDIEVYTPTGTYDQSWAPVITNVPPLVNLGQKYTLSGTQLTGLSGASAYGDDEQNATNYPLIRITNNATKHVFYVPQSNLSTRAIATGSLIESATFSVPSSLEIGPSTIQVVTNGIPSAAKVINVSGAIPASKVFVYQGLPSTGIGAPSAINALDNNTFGAGSQSTAAGQTAAIEADYSFPITGANGLSLFTAAKAAKGVTEQVYAYNFVSKTFVLVNSIGLAATMTSATTPVTVNGSQYISSTGQVKVLVRGVLPNHVSPATYTLSVDCISVGLK